MALQRKSNPHNYIIISNQSELAIALLKRVQSPMEIVAPERIRLSYALDHRSGYIQHSEMTPHESNEKVSGQWWDDAFAVLDPCVDEDHLNVNLRVPIGQVDHLHRNVQIPPCKSHNLSFFEVRMYRFAVLVLHHLISWRTLPPSRSRDPNPRKNARKVGNFVQMLQTLLS